MKKVILSMLVIGIMSVLADAESCTSVGATDKKYTPQGDCAYKTETRTCCKGGNWSEWNKECDTLKPNCGELPKEDYKSYIGSNSDWATEYNCGANCGICVRSYECVLTDENYDDSWEWVFGKPFCTACANGYVSKVEGDVQSGCVKARSGEFYIHRRAPLPWTWTHCGSEGTGCGSVGNLASAYANIGHYNHGQVASGNSGEWGGHNSELCKRPDGPIVYVLEDTLDCSCSEKTDNVHNEGCNFGESSFICTASVDIAFCRD